MVTMQMQSFATNDVDESHPPTTDPNSNPSSQFLGIDGNVLFDLSPLLLTVLTPSCRIARASDRFLQDWQVPRDECVGEQLVAFLEKYLRPAGSTATVHITSTIDDAISCRAERTSKPIAT